MSVEVTRSKTSVQQMLNSFGPPPPEVCLDWAWQLLRYSEMPLDAGSDPSTQWSNWWIAEDGSLQAAEADAFFPRPSTQFALTIPSEQNRELDPDRELTSDRAVGVRIASEETNPYATLISQLLEWAGAEWEAASDRFSPLVQRQLLHAMVGRIAASRAAEPSSPPEKLERPTQHAVGSSPRIAEPTRTAASDSFGKVPNLRPPAIRKPKKRKKATVNKHSRIKHFAVAVALPCALVGTAWYWFSTPGDQPTTRPVLESSSTTAKVPDQELLAMGPTVSLATNPESEAFQASTISTSTVDGSDVNLQTSDTVLHGTQVVSQPDDRATISLNTDQSLSSIADSLGGLISEEPKRQAEESPAALDATNDSTVSEHPDQGLAIAEITNDSLLSDDVSELMRGVLPSEPTIGDISVESEDAGTKAVPAQLIATGQMLQTLRLPERIRVKEPYWRLRLITSDSFTIQPEAPLELGEKAIISWTLLPKDSARKDVDDELQIVLQAQLAGRRPDIRWLISASSKDIPSFMVPLDPKRLELMLATLLELQNRAAAAIELAKAQSNQPGLPRSLRSSITHRRKVLEEHGKTLQRIERLVANASLYATWLGESLEVHGELIDKSNSEQPITVLRIGEGVDEN